MYNRFQENKRIEISVEYTAKIEAHEEKAIAIAKAMLEDNEPNERILKYTGLGIEQIEELRYGVIEQPDNQ